MPDRVISVPQATQIAQRIKNKFDNVNGRLQQYDGVLYETSQTELQTTELDGYYSNETWHDDAVRSTKKADVSGLETVHIVGTIANYYNIYTFTNENDEIISYLRASEATNTDDDYAVPENAKYVYVSANTKAAGETIHIYRYDTTSKMDEIENDVADMGDRVDTAESTIAEHEYDIKVLTANSEVEIEGYSKAPNSIDLLGSATKTTGAFKRVTGEDSIVASWNYYALAVTEGDVLYIKSYANSAAKAFLFFDADSHLVSYYPTGTFTPGYYEDTVEVPSGATVLYVNQNTVSPAIDVNKPKGYIFKRGSVDFENLVRLVKDGNQLQIQSAFDDGFMLINASTNGSKNGSFNFSTYEKIDTISTDGNIESGTTYKNTGDDICPIHYNGSYRGGNHGKAPSFLVTLAAHGLTEADIGSVWTGANERRYVVYKIDSADTFSLVGDLDGSRYDVGIFPPTAPLTHTSGATHTGALNFTSVANTQIWPGTKAKTLKITNDEGAVLDGSGVLDGKYIQIDETYECIDIVELITTLKANVGNNTNDSYYAETLNGEMLIQNSYRFQKGGVVIVTCNAIPLKSGIYLEYWGGVQSGEIGDDIYVPFTDYGSVQTQGTESVTLSAETWSDPNFPAYKMYQFDGSTDRGFSLGYCIDYGQGLPTNRKDYANVGFYYGPTHKMYPHFYHIDLANAPDFYGQCLSFYCYRAPVMKNSVMVILYEIDGNYYTEIEVLSTFTGLVELPTECIGKKIEVVKKSDTLSVLPNIVSAKGIYVSGSGSATLKLY